MSDDMEKMITAMLQAKVIQALNETPEAIDKLVKAAMEKPVDPDTGRRDGYGYNKVPYLEWLVGNELRNAAATVVRDVVKEQALPAIEAQVRAKLSSAEITQSFVGAISAALKDEWRINVHFDREKDR